MTRLVGVVRGCCAVLRWGLVFALVVWAAAAPLLWILRDGLGPGAVDSTGPRAVHRFLLAWGPPAVFLVWAILAALLIGRLLAVPAPFEEE